MHRSRPPRHRPIPLCLALAPLLLLVLACTPASSPDDAATAASADAPTSAAQPVALSSSRDPNQLFPPCNRYDNVQDMGPLPPIGEITERPFTESYEAHRYTLHVEAGDYVHVVVEQKKVDLVVSLLDEAGRGLLRVDSLYGDRGLEEVHWIEEQGGQRSLLVCAGVDIHDGTGYNVQIKEQNPPNLKAKSASEAFLVYQQAEANRRRGTEASRHEALQLYHEAAELWRILGRDHGVALAVNGISRIHTELQDDTDTSINYVKQAIGLLQETGDLFLEGSSRHRLGTLYEVKNNHTKALHEYEKAVEIRRQIHHLRGQISSLSNIAGIYNAQGDLAKTQDLYIHILELTELSGSAERTADVLRALGNLHITLNDGEQGLKNISRALEIHTALDRTEDIADSLSSLGGAYRSLNRFEKSIPYFQKALKLYQDLGNKRKTIGALISRGTSEVELEDYETARETFKKALELSLENELIFQEANSRLNIGWIKAETGDCAGAIEDFKHAANGFELSDNLHLRALSFLNVAICQKWIGNHRKSLEFALSATALSEYFRDRALSMSWQAKFFAQRRYYYDVLVDVLIELSEEELAQQYLLQAVETSERSKARTLLDALEWEGAGQLYEHEQATMDRIGELTRKINQKISRQLLASSGLGDPRADSEVRLDLERLEFSTRKLHNRIEIQRDQPPPTISSETIRDILKEDTTLLEYHIGYWESHLWLVDTDRVLHFSLPSQSELEKIFSVAYRNISSKARPVQTQMILQDISDLVLGDALNEVKTRRILFVKDGPLHYLPLDSLPLPTQSLSTNPQSSSLDGPKLIGDHFETLSTPSMSVMAKIRERREPRRSKSKRMAVFADPILTLDDTRIEIFQNSSPRPLEEQEDISGYLERLIYSGEEAKAITDIAARKDWNVELALGPSASASIVTGGGVSDAQIIHFATHADFHSRQPEFAHLAFSSFDLAGHMLDGSFLFAFELYPLDLKADLVVLSACSSALGSDIHGEGLVGLTQGFIQAGAAQVLVSLWQVDDRATAELMRHFYHFLLVENLSSTEALWKAKRSIRQQPEWHSPYFWAGFSLQGDWLGQLE